MYLGSANQIVAVDHAVAQVLAEDSVLAGAVGACVIVQVAEDERASELKSSNLVLGPTLFTGDRLHRIENFALFHYNTPFLNKL